VVLVRTAEGEAAGVDPPPKSIAKDCKLVLAAPAAERWLGIPTANPASEAGLPVCLTFSSLAAIARRL
jgi:hypothetical protein